MKHSIKKMKFILYFCLATLFFSSCEKELYEEPLRKKVKYVTISEVPFLMPSIIEYNKEYKNYSTISRAEEAIFDLDLDKILEYEVDGKKTYSIIINKEFTEFEDKYIENLHVYLDSNNELKSLILKYNPTNDNIPFDIKTLTGVIELFDKDKNQISYTTYENGNKAHLKWIFSIGCVYFDVYSDGSIVVLDNCFESGSGLSGSGVTSGSSGTVGSTGSVGTGSSSTSGSSSTGTGENSGAFLLGDPTALILPNVPEIFENESIVNNETPCEQLKNLIKQDTVVPNDYEDFDTIRRPNLLTELLDLRTKVNDSVEHGYELSFRKFSGVSHQYTKDNVVASAANFELELYVKEYYYGGIHTHPLGGNEIPSFNDLIWLRKCYDGAANYNKNKVISILVVKNPVAGALPTTFTYALKIDDIVTYNQKINEILNSYPSNLSENDKIDEEHKKEQEYYNPNHPENFEKLFLEKFKDFGFSIYRADDNLMNWNKLSLTTTIPANVIQTPCSN